jgi:hypothetical protein
VRPSLDFYRLWQNPWPRLAALQRHSSHVTRKQFSCQLPGRRRIMEQRAEWTTRTRTFAQQQERMVGLQQDPPSHVAGCSLASYTAQPFGMSVLCLDRGEVPADVGTLFMRQFCHPCARREELQLERRRVGVRLVADIPRGRLAVDGVE